MKPLRCSFITDGSSDRALVPHLRWLLRENGVVRPIRIDWAELRHLPKVPRGLAHRIEKSVELYPCDLLFVHKDAEKDDPLKKSQEVSAAIGQLESALPPIVCVIPVRMQEAWLLFDEAAIRRAAGNPNGRIVIDLPRLNTLENLPDPKEILHGLLRSASERSGRRLRQFNVGHSAMQVSQFVDDFAPLRIVPAFQRLEAELQATIGTNGWNTVEDN